jgi:hypothetical protein
MLVGAMLAGCGGALSLESDPAGAAIWLDGDSTGLVTPALLPDLPARRHEVRLRSPGLEWRTTTSISAGDTGVVHAILPVTLWSWGEPGARFSTIPAVASDHTCAVVAYTGYDENERLLAFDSAGVLRWQARLGDGYCPSPIIDDAGVIYAVAPDSILAFAPDGAVLWGLPATGSARPALALGADNTVYAACNDTLRAIQSGTERWRCPLAGTAKTRPVVGSDGTIYVQTSTELVAIAPTGSTKWRYVFDAPARAGYLAIDGSGNVYCRTRSALIGIRPDGTERWRFVCGDPEPVPGPAIAADGTVFTKLDRWFCAVDSTSRFLWASSEPLFSCHATAALAADGSILVSTSGWYAADYYAAGSLTCLYPDGSLHWRRTTTPNALTWQAPMLVDDRLYVTVSDSVFCIRLGTTAASAPWPMFQHDARHTGRAGAH